MSFEDRPTAKDMRLAGENYCIDCPDPEACHQGASCDLVRIAAEDSMKGTRADFVIFDEAQQLPETDEERLNRTNNVSIIKNPKGTPMPTSEQNQQRTADKEPEADFDQDTTPDDEYTQPGVMDYAVAVRDKVRSLNTDKVLGYVVLAAAAYGLLRRKQPKQPKRMRVDYHHYYHQENEKDSKKK